MSDFDTYIFQVEDISLFKAVYRLAQKCVNSTKFYRRRV